MAIELMASEEYVDGKVATEAQARTLLAATVQTHTSSLASLSSRVGDNETAIANRYTKSEVDAKVAGVQTFQKLVVNELPSAEAADDKTIYLVPRTGSETPDLCDEYVTVGAAGSRRWEKIGGGTVDVTLDNTVTPASAHGVKSSGIWSAIWGALTALPTGFASLYDWVVAQLAGKYEKPNGGIPASDMAQSVQASLGKADTALPLAGGTMTGDLTARNLISRIRFSIGGEVGGAKFILHGATNEHYIQFAYQNSKYGLFVKNGANDTGTFYALADFAPLASPAFTGTPTAPTPTAGDNSTKVATTAFVQGAISGISVTPLSGQTFNFATTQGVMDALKTVIEALGGTVTNAPSNTISQGE